MISIESLRFQECLWVHKAGRKAGELRRTPTGAEFSYDSDYLRTNGEPLAFTLPLSHIRHQTKGDTVHPFFAGLLPEGRRLSCLVRTLKTSPDDLFTLLAASGSDVVGDVYLTVPGAQIPKLDLLIQDYSQVDFFDIFERSITNTDLSYRDVDSAISGILPKVSAQMISFPATIAARNKRYIVKLGPKEFPRIVQNEHVVMQLARKAGIDVATTSIVQDGAGNEALLVERFDRVHREGQMKSLHQEDACQFLGYYPADKYRITFAEVLQGIALYASAPIVASMRLLELLAFSYLVCNGDLHAKNISLLQDLNSQRVGLSPAYDLLSTLPYGDDSMALQFEGRTKNFKRKDFIACGKRWNITEKAVSKQLDKLIKVIATATRDGSLQAIGLTDCQHIHLTITIETRLKQLAR